MAKILIVEDDAAISNAYGLHLTKMGYEVSIAENAEKALNLAKSKPDIILLDMLMPEMSGLDFLKSLDPKKTLPDTKIIVLSNTESPKIRADAEDYGIASYLLKIDYTPEQIGEVIKKQLG